jgi:2-oxoglutarate ferredoxin oxidoreductase subunit gamma
MEFRIIISGTGGQGVISAGEFLSEALFREGYEVVATRSYGAEARGGSARSEVIVSDEEIYDLEINEASVIIAMSMPAYRSFIGRAGKEALILVEKQILAELTDKDLKENVHLVEIPANEIAGALGNPVVANMVFLGALIKKTGLLTPEKLEETVKKLFRSALQESNIKAIRAGYSMV